MTLKIDINISVVSWKDTDSDWGSEWLCKFPRVTQLVNDGINVSLYTVILDNGKQNILGVKDKQTNVWTPFV